MITPTICFGLAYSFFVVVVISLFGLMLKISKVLWGTHNILTIFELIECYLIYSDLLAPSLYPAVGHSPAAVLPDARENIRQYDNQYQVI